MTDTSNDELLQVQPSRLDQKIDPEFAAEIAARCERVEFHDRAYHTAKSEQDKRRRNTIHGLIRRDAQAAHKRSAHREHRDCNPLPAMRLKDMMVLLRKRYGEHLPNVDGIGEEELPAYLWHVALVANERGKPMVRAMRLWCEVNAPWATADAIQAVAGRISQIKHPKMMGAKKLGALLMLRDDERALLGIRTIRAFDITDAELEDRSRSRNRERMAEKRRAQGARAQSQSLSKTEPWKAEGVHRRTWERRRKRETETAANSCAIYKNKKEDKANTKLRHAQSHDSQPWLSLGISRAAYFRQKKAGKLPDRARLKAAPPSKLPKEQVMHNDEHEADINTAPTNSIPAIARPEAR